MGQPLWRACLLFIFKEKRMLILQNLSYSHPDKDVLFEDINLTINKYDKVALIGNNGTGKSTLLKIIASGLIPSKGQVHASSKPYYLPQIAGQFNELTVAKALAVDDKLMALEQILAGNVTEEHLNVLSDDWAIEERCIAALKDWDVADIGLNQKLGTLSGGQKTKVFLAGITLRQPQIVLLDEPSNHLDTAGRARLYDFVSSCPCTLVVVSHDRKLLNMLDSVIELSNKGITHYGGNYDFYAGQKMVVLQAISRDVQSKEKVLRKARETARETAERQQKLDARGKKKQEKSGLPTISMNTFKNNAEKSTARIKGVHAEKIAAVSGELSEMRKELPDADTMRFGFDNATLHRGKVLITASGMNFSYNGIFLWKQGLGFEIRSGERVAIKGANGSGKTTLIKLMLGAMSPTAGTMYNAINNAVYIDQEYSLLNSELSIYAQAQTYNKAGLEEHEVKILLARFLFTAAFWDKPCGTLSGGQKMRLVLCCLAIGAKAPDIIILDEPTNNLDIPNVEIMTTAINDYRGTLVVISHDECFLGQINTGKAICLG
jgi:ATPase subunit of ABC transporter with duplicated ATPase domains